MEKITHQGKIIEVVHKEVKHNNKTQIFEFARRSPGARLIIPKGEKIILTKEWRHEINGYDYRLPGGKVFDSLNEYNNALEQKIDISESAKNAAIKEAKEEVGIQVKEISFFHKSVCGATVVWDLFYFVVNDFIETSQELEDGEDITVELVDLNKVKEMCLSGEIGEERSALVIMRYLNNLEN
ncbi:MAG: NUDIX hydrolase [Candidatus Paceibacterota bacterium]